RPGRRREQARRRSGIRLRRRRHANSIRTPLLLVKPGPPVARPCGRPSPHDRCLRHALGLGHGKFSPNFEFFGKIPSPPYLPLIDTHPHRPHPAKPVRRHPCCSTAIVTAFVAAIS